MIVANEPYTDQLYLQKSSWLLFTSVYFNLIPQILRGSIDQKHAKTNEVWRQKQWNPPSFRLFSLASMISRSFQTVRRMREAWKWETYVRSQSFSSESAVKYLHVGLRKIQISPPLGEQDHLTRYTYFMDEE